MSEEERKFLEIVDLKKGFGSGETRQEVLRGMNFSVAKGEFCVLLGPSGSGKSTLLNIIGGIDSAFKRFLMLSAFHFDMSNFMIFPPMNNDTYILYFYYIPLKKLYKH